MKDKIIQAVTQALEAMGITDDQDFYGEQEGIGPENRVPIWTELKAGELGSTPGQIHDKQSLMKVQQSKPPMASNYGMPIDDESSEMMVAMGLV